MVVFDVTEKAAAVPLNRTAVAPLKFVPVIVTLAPTGPLAGVTPEIVGAGMTVSCPALVAGPPGRCAADVRAGNRHARADGTVSRREAGARGCRDDRELTGARRGAGRRGHADRAGRRACGHGCLNDAIRPHREGSRRPIEPH